MSDTDPTFVTERVMLDVTYDQDAYPSPSTWDWAILADLPDRDHVTVVGGTVADDLRTLIERLRDREERTPFDLGLIQAYRHALKLVEGTA